MPGLDDQTTAHILRHTFATHTLVFDAPRRARATLIRGGTDLVIVAELLGHPPQHSREASRLPCRLP